MATLALVLYALLLVVAVGLRMLLQVRRTGSTGFKGISGRPGSVDWWGGVLFAFGVGLGAAAPALALFDVLEPIAVLDGTGAHAVGILLAGVGMAGTVTAQLAMGASWRIGVDEAELTELVTEGPFRVVRNPIYAAMLPTILGLALMVPSVLAISGVVALLASLELQTRRVEEPYLLRVHGRAYADYASRVGRFLPGIGRL